MIAKITGVILQCGSYTNKNGAVIPTADIYIEADGDTVRVNNLDCHDKKRFESITLDVAVRNGEHGLYVYIPKN